MARWPGSPGALRRFAGRWLVAFLAVAALWVVIAPIYNRFMAWSADLAFAAVESPDVTRVEADGDRLWILRHIEGGEMKPFMSFDLYVYVGFIPLVALLLATPGLRRWARLRAILAGIALLAVLHIGFLVGAVRLLYVAYGLDAVSGAGSTVCQWAQVLLRVIWEGAALVIWAALALRAWRNDRSPAGWRATPARAAAT